MTFRDDDINCDTDLAVFKPIHEHFRKALVMHTVAIICKDFDKNLPLIDFIKKNNINPQVHCWEHYSMPDNLDKLQEDIPKCLRMFEVCGFDRPTTIYPPWNKQSFDVRKIADQFDLKVSWQKVSLSYYVKNNGVVTPDVINFHHWDSECDDLEEALRIYNTKR